MRRKTNEDPRMAPTPPALRDEELAAVAGASLQAYLAFPGVKTGAYDGQHLIGVGSCTK